MSADAVRPILVTGANGQLGIELKRCAWPGGYRILALDRLALDLSDSAAIARRVAAGQDGTAFAAVVNCAAYTAVDKAESDVVTAWTVNALAPAAFGEACAKADIPLVHVSTDYVFAGDSPRAWEVDDPVAPVSVYGGSKLGGEIAIRTSGVRHVIVRTAWVVSAHGSNFVKTMLRLAEARDTVSVVDDQMGSPTGAADLASALMTITVRLIEDEAAPVGTFHFSNAGAVSWASFAREIFSQSASRGGPTATVTPIATADYPTPAKRPANSLLSHVAIQRAYGITPRPWPDALCDILSELLPAEADALYGADPHSDARKACQ